MTCSLYSPYWLSQGPGPRPSGPWVWVPGSVSGSLGPGPRVPCPGSESRSITWKQLVYTVFISNKCRHIVPTPGGSILQPPRASQVPYNAKNQILPVPYILPFGSVTVRVLGSGSQVLGSPGLGPRVRIPASWVPGPGSRIRVQGPVVVCQSFYMFF